MDVQHKLVNKEIVVHERLNESRLDLIRAEESGLELETELFRAEQDRLVIDQKISRLELDKEFQ